MPIQVQCPNCQKTAMVPDNAAGKQVRCKCGKAFVVPAPAPAADPLELSSNDAVSHQPPPAPMAAQAASSEISCPKCQTVFPPTTRICVKCGIDLATGQPLKIKQPARDGPDIPDFGDDDNAPRAGWLGDTFPGLFVPRAALAGIIGVVVGLPLIGAAFYAESLVFGAIGLIAFVQALTFLIVGDLVSFHVAMPDFRGKDWSTMLVILFTPFACGLIFLKLTMREDTGTIDKPDFHRLISSKPEVPKEIVQPPSPYTILSVEMKGGGNSFREDNFLPAAHGVAVAPNGDIYYSYVAHGQILKFTAATGQVAAIAGGEKDPGDGLPATEALINAPAGLALDRSGNLYIYDTRYVRKIDAKTGIIDAYGGQYNPGPRGDGGPANKAWMTTPLARISHHRIFSA